MSMKIISEYDVVDDKILKFLHEDIAMDVACGPAYTPLDGEYETVEEYVTSNPRQTIYLRANGTSMVGAGINSGDLVAVDTKLEPRDGDIVLVCIYDSEYTIKEWRPPHLIGHGPEGRTELPLTEDMNATALGVVCTVIRRMRQ